MLYFARWRFHYKSLPSKIMARVSRHKRGRPPKFGRPSRLVALTLPTLATLWLLSQGGYQVYFPDEVTSAVYARAPYDRHPNRDTTNATDRFLGQIADKSLVMWTMARDGDGYVAAATVALRTS